MERGSGRKGKKESAYECIPVPYWRENRRMPTRAIMLSVSGKAIDDEG